MAQSRDPTQPVLLIWLSAVIAAGLVIGGTSDLFTQASCRFGYCLAAIIALLLALWYIEAEKQGLFGGRSP